MNDGKTADTVSAAIRTLTVCKDKGDAKAAVEEAMRMDPRDRKRPEVARILAWALAAENHLTNAYSVLADALEVAPNDLDLVARQVDLALRMGKWREALRALEQLAPSCGLDLSRKPLGLASIESRDKTRETSVFSIPEVAERLLACWAPLGEHERGLELLEAFSAPNSITCELSRAFEECFDSAARGGRSDISLTGYGRLIRNDEESFILKLKSAEIHQESGQFEKADQLITAVLKDSPGLALARLMGRRVRRLFDAQRVAELRILLDRRARPYDGKGIRFELDGTAHSSEPSSAFDDALAHGDDLIENELKLVLARYESRLGEAERSLKTLQSIHFPEPFLRVELAALKGMIWHRKGFPDLALEELRRVGADALARNGFGEEAGLLAALLEEAGRWEASLKAARHAARAKGAPDQRDRIARIENLLRTKLDDGEGLPGAGDVVGAADSARPEASGSAAVASSSDPDGTVAAGTLIDGLYEVLALLGKGGMGTVLKVLNRRLDRIEALKLLPESSTQESEADWRTVREARLIAGLVHPNIVRVYGLGHHKGRPYITMEFLEGETLGQILRQRGRLESSEVGPIACQVAAGLLFAHSNGIVHRDVKPDNVMVLTGSREVKLMDFGLAIDLGASSGVRRESFLGTIHYISPEQVNGENVDQRADIYSFGVVLYEMLTGQAPFDSPNPHNLMFMHLTRTPPSPRLLRPEISIPVETLILRCLEKAPTRRPQDFGEILRSLQIGFEHG